MFIDGDDRGGLVSIFGLSLCVGVQIDQQSAQNNTEHHQSLFHGLLQEGSSVRPWSRFELTPRSLK